MKLALFLAFAPVVAFAQLPAQVNVTVSQDPYTRYTRPLFEAQHDMTEALMGAARNRIEQEKVDIERERLRFEERQAEAAMRQTAPENLSYRDAHPQEAAWRLSQDVKDAIRTCRERHADCERLDGMMNIISKAVRPDWTQLTMTEYVECLYAIAKNAVFAEQARAMVLRSALPAPGK